MAGVVYEHMALIDTSAVIALLDPSDRFHTEARAFFDGSRELAWFTLNATAHELFTRVRYDSGLAPALSRYDFLRTESFRILTFDGADEQQARALLAKYDDQVLSFHDALCAIVALRQGIYKVFSFDKDFWVMGFEVLPGRTTYQRPFC